MSIALAHKVEVLEGVVAAQGRELMELKRTVEQMQRSAKLGRPPKTDG